jgi:hypothetical protein
MELLPDHSSVWGQHHVVQTLALAGTVHALTKNITLALKVQI